MNNVLTPTIGTNGFVKKFDAKAKRKFKVKFATKVKISLVVLLLMSLAGNYLLLKSFMVFQCKVNLENAGYFVSKAKCGELNDNWNEASNKSIELHNSEMLKLNPDL